MQQQRNWHFIVSASDLIGSPVYDSKRERAGEIEYIMVGLDDGEVRHVVISSGGFLDIGEELRVIPWSAFDTPVSRTAARMNVSKNALQESYRTTEEKLGDLTRPAVMTEVTDYWAPLVTDKEGSVGKSTGKSGSQSEAKAKASGEPKKSEQAAKDRSDAKSKSAGSMSKKDEQGVPHILVGRGVITTIVAPQVESAQELVGASVRGADGKDVGEIDHLMIETSSGRVAYVLVSRDGFLGYGGEWVPVPFEVLSWSPKMETVNLNVKAGDLKKMKFLPKTERPRSVRRSDLAKLYEQYNIKPFWTKVDQDEIQTRK
jgi:sporulation protein YlmC with PRC-barrel domain